MVQLESAEMADASDEGQKTATIVQHAASKAAESSESRGAVRTEGEAQVRDIVAKHNANIEALNAAVEAEASRRETQLAETLQALEASLQKAVDDFEPEKCEKIQAEVDEVKAAAENTTALNETCAKKLEELQAAHAALTAADTALNAAAEKKLAEAKEAMKTKEFTKAKTLKAEAEDLKARIVTVAAGKDNAGREERQQMEDEARVLESALADARTEGKRCEEELALLPKTADAFACAAVGCPMGSKLCWTANNDDITEGEVGTVVGFLHGQGKVEVKFSQVTWPLAPDQLMTLQEWQKREAVRF